MIIFAMYIFITMLIVAGMAVDPMRFETNRSLLQAKLDRAVLAAADLDQTLDPESVMRDYFDKAGLLENITGVAVTGNTVSRTVAATASLDVDTDDRLGHHAQRTHAAQRQDSGFGAVLQAAGQVETRVGYVPAFSVGLADFTFEELVVTRPRFAGQVCMNTSNTGGGATATC